MLGIVNSKLLSLGICSLLVVSSVLTAQTAVVLKYGTITSVQAVKKDSKHAGGALAGGMVGALAAGPRHHALKVAASAAAGAAIQGALTGGTIPMYTVFLTDGTTVEITSEQQDMRPGDCVVVELGDHANIRRTGSIHCESQHRPRKPPAQHQAAADECQAAKDELVKADTDNEVDLAVKKVRTLCED